MLGWLKSLIFFLCAEEDTEQGYKDKGKRNRIYTYVL